MHSSSLVEPGEVTSLTVSSSSPDSLTVSWDPPSNTLCPVDSYTVHYQLTYRDQCDGTGGPKTPVTGITESPVTITGLHAYSSYDVFVTATNTFGSSEKKTSGITAVTSKIHC